MVDTADSEETRNKRKLILKEIDKQIGNKLKERREELNLSRRELSNKMKNLSTNQIQRYEKGTNTIAVSTLYKLSKALGVSVGWFFENIND